MEMNHEANGGSLWLPLIVLGVLLILFSVPGLLYVFYAIAMDYLMRGP